MKDKLFKELQESIIEGSKILNGKKRVGREFNFENSDPKEIKDRVKLLTHRKETK